MRVVRNIEELRESRRVLEGSVGFVPTMGALHAGHLSLISRAKEENDAVIVSIFVNPTQFLVGEDFDSYPNKEIADEKICQVAGVDILFIPNKEQIYNSDELAILAPAIRGYILEGEKRPGHFDGVLQVVMKLFNLTTPTRAYFGKKDAQQLVLITQMVQDYFIPCQVIPCDIVRDQGGLALSSRNAYLNDEEKERAYILSRSLKRAFKKIMSGERDAKILIAQIQKEMHSVDRLEYVAIVNRDFRRVDYIEIGNTIILIAAYIGSTRLIDNIWI